jgi:hypothetical protein
MPTVVPAKSTCRGPNTPRARGSRGSILKFVPRWKRMSSSARWIDCTVFCLDSPRSAHPVIAIPGFSVFVTMLRQLRGLANLHFECQVLERLVSSTSAEEGPRDPKNGAPARLNQPEPSRWRVSAPRLHRSAASPLQSSPCFGQEHRLTM